MNLKHVWSLFLASVLVLLPMNIYRLTLDSESTSYKRMGVYCLIALFIFALILFIMTKLIKDLKEDSIAIKTRNFGMMSFIAGTGIFCYGISTVLTALFGIKTEIIVIIFGILGILSGLVLILFALCSFKGENILKKIHALAFLPPIWICIYIYRIYNMYSHGEAEKIDRISVVSMSFFALFLVYSLKANLENAAGAQKKAQVFSSGLVSCMCIFTTQIPNFIKKISIGTFNTLYLDDVLSLILGIYAIVFLIELTRNKELKSEENQVMLKAKV